MEGEGDEAWCPSCGVRYQRGGEGGLLQVSNFQGSLKPVFGHSVAASLSPEGESGPGGGHRRAQVGARRASGRESPVIHGGEVVGFAEALGEVTEGTLELTDNALVLWGPEEEAPPMDQWALLDIRAVQTTSSALQISPITGGVVQFRFLDDSPLRWEELLHARIREEIRKEGRGEVLEFQPRIVASRDRVLSSEPKTEREPRLLPGEAVAWSFREAPVQRLNWYGLVKALARVLMLLGTRTRIRGLGEVPRKGPFILVANHQSILDPILVQAACPRPLHTLTKSTQFGKGLFRWLLPRLNAIPTRRYTVEPQAIRVMLRRLREGRGVGIYPEGERSWDGSLQPFRRGTIRFLLRAGVPVIPCGVSGTYDVWPRWSRKLRRRSVKITFGGPLDLPAVHSREEAEALVDDVARRLKKALAALGAWTEEGPPQETW